ncbi:MAG: 3-phosphoshikimate 1-carboxyvinyltransferase [Thermodesulfobacteriota bacterium]|nr:3-phosphoshikimate 1-carboxyvinyltransferase [Thermodesulfobacteriota bacterium]
MQAPRTITVQAPPSKSLSHRALIAAGLAHGQSTLSGVLKSRDTEQTMACMSACGAGFEFLDDSLRVAGISGNPKGGTREPVSLDVGESGTTCRLITAVAAAGEGLFSLDGQGRMRERPLGALTKALTELGAEFEWKGKEGFPPFILHANGLSGENVAVDVGESSQYLSGLLLASPLAKDPLTIEISGEKIVSWPYVALSLQILEDFGIQVAVEIKERGSWSAVPWRGPLLAEPGKVRFKIQPGDYKAGEYQIEGDWSNASYFLAAGALGPSAVRVTGLRRDSLQGDRAILNILKRMGANIIWEENAVTVMPSGLNGVVLNMGACPDLVPTVAVLASQAKGETRIHNVAHLRLKESDRLAAVAEELSRTGCGTMTLEGGLRVYPSPPSIGRAVEFKTYNDHRMAMSLSLLSLAGIQVRLDNPGCVDKSFPGFWDQWKKIVPS